MNGFWNYWNSLSQGARDGIVGGVISALVVAVIAGVLKLSGISIRALFRRIFSPPVVLPLSPPVPQIIVNVPQPTLPPPTEPSQTAERISSTPLIPKSPVVGFVARRDKEGRDILQLLKEELSPGRNQLIALWGEGGIGKTTLAAEAARALSADYKQRVVLTSADRRADYTFSTFLDEIASRLNRADILRLAIEPKMTEVQSLIASEPTLVVLDNFETISINERELCSEFLEHKCPHPALITTREMVGDARNILIDAMSPAEAKEFLGRLIKLSPEPKIFAGVQAEKIIHAAAANPLAMEWVVAQINLAQKPADVLDDLAEGESDAAQRVFDRSFNLPQLGDDGRAALLALSLFVPSASRIALADVAGFGSDEQRLNDAVKRLATLRLVNTTDGGEQLTIQGLTRELAKSHLKKDGRATEFRQRFVARLLSYAKSHSQPTAEDYDALESEKDNLVSAIDVAFGSKDWSSVQKFAYVLGVPVTGMLSVRGYWDEAIRTNEQALESAFNSASERETVVFGHNLAMMHANRGEIDKARVLHNESLRISKKLGDQRSIAVILHELARLAQNQGELDEAQRLYHESLEIAREKGDQSGIASSLHQLAMLIHDQGNLDEARRLYHESLEIKKRLGDQSGIASSLHQLALLANDLGDLDEARRLCHESLEIKKRLRNQSGIASSLHQLAMLAQKQGELFEARRLYQESLEINRKLGNQSGIASCLHQLGMLIHDQGDLDEARRLYHASLEIKRTVGDQNGIAISLGQLGMLAEDEGKNAEAIRLFGEALAIFEKLKSPYAELARQSLARVRGDDKSASE